MRDVAIDKGGFIGLAFYPFTKTQIMDNCVKHSISRCWRLGRAILEARKDGTPPFAAIQNLEGGKLIFKGKITDLKREISEGFNFGHLDIEGFEEYAN